MLTRRDFLAGAAVAAGALAAPAGRAVAAPATFDGTIRVLGLSPDLQTPGIPEQAHHDLGFEIVSALKQPADIHHLVSQEPATFDVFSCFAQDAAEFWASANLQPVEIARIQQWRNITPLYTLGKAVPGSHSPYGQGDAAFRRLYVDPDRSGRWPSAPRTARSVAGVIVQWVNEKTGKRVGREPRLCTGVPSCFGFDSFGYNADVLRKRPGELTWAELLNRRWQGRVALNGVDPQGSLQDVANAVQAARLMRFRDLGNPTRKELDRLFKLLLAYRKRGQFFNLWTDPQNGPVDWMKSRKVVLSAMWVGHIASLAALDFPVHQAAPREGYRAWAGLMMISNEVRDQAKLDACYDLLNWFHSGFAGSVLMRWGFYNAVQATARRFVTAPGEYAYWIDGKPAAQTYAGPYGDKSVLKGWLRDGGSFLKRAGRISSWNSTPSLELYFLDRWDDFTSGFPAPGP